MKIELPLKSPPSLFVSITGKNGVHELRAILSTGSTYTIVPWKDAFQLGYQPFYDARLGEGWGITAPTVSTYIDAPLITLEEVRIGPLKATNVEAIVHDMAAPVDVLLGISFLKNFNITLDYGKGVLIIEELGQ